MSFKTQQRLGDIGESLFYQAHNGELAKHSGQDGDFISPDGVKYELKSDLYCMSKTPNFFMERWGNKEMGKAGGPWQALEHGSKFFCYFFVSNLTVFKFETAKLVSKLDELAHTFAVVNVPNKAYTTVGYRVPRETLSPLYEKLNLTVGFSA